MTDDPSAVTCQLCLARLNDDLSPVEESGPVRQMARQTARSRATTRLVAAHRDEFERLIADELPAATREAIEMTRRVRELTAERPA